MARIKASKKLNGKVEQWSSREVAQWLNKRGFSRYSSLFCSIHNIDGPALLSMNESDLRGPPLEIKVLGDIKRLMLAIREIQQKSLTVDHSLSNNSLNCNICSLHRSFSDSSDCSYQSSDASNQDGRHIKPPKAESWKALVAFFYFICVTFLNSVATVIADYQVPNTQTHPPLPDIFLDNFPLVPWGFFASEMTGMILLLLSISILVLHKHRSILLRRWCNLYSTIILLRCVTLIMTSLSVSGKHMQCKTRSYGNWKETIIDAISIWQKAGLVSQGVSTCGDYMFSGHTVVLTLCNFFINEYSPRRMYYLHTITWVLNLFGMFFILAAHEHYTIDVFIAFYITNRLFLYYHTLANNRALMQDDSMRTRISFPLFYFFESGVCGPVPNEYAWPFKIPLRVKKLLENILRNRYTAVIFK